MPLAVDTPAFEDDQNALACLQPFDQA